MTLHAARRWRMACRALALATSLTMALLFPTLARAVALNQISADVYSNPGSQHQTEVEPDTFAFGPTVVATFQVGRYFDGGASNIGWSTSTDNGVTWQFGFLPGITKVEGGPYDRVSDPSVAYDAVHDVWMISSLAITEPVRGAAVVLSRSTNGGLTWDNPVTAAFGGNLDKNWTVCDNGELSPFAGRCYTQWDDNGAGNRIKMSTSTDGGLTWGFAQETADRASGLGGQPVVQPDGTVVVPYSGNFGSVRSFVSTDGGDSWSATVLVAAILSHPVSGVRAPPIPSAEVDADGRVYVAWHDCRFRAGCRSNDIVMSSSDDGLIWTAVTRVPIDDMGSPVDHFIPGLGVDSATAGSTGHLALAFYYYPDVSCTPVTCELMAGFVASADGGATWTPNLPLTDSAMRLSWLPNTNQGRMVGDYISTSHTEDGTAHPVIAVARTPFLAFDQAMHTPVSGLAHANPSAASRRSEAARALPEAPPATGGFPTLR